MTPSHDDPPTVLIAEDEPLASMALRAQLEALDYRVIATARDGDEAVLLGTCLPVDLGLFDLRTGLTRAYAGFLDWYESDDERAHRVRRARDERHITARAVQRLAADTSTLVAATRLVQRARDQRRPLVDVARQILNQEEL